MVVDIARIIFGLIVDSVSEVLRIPLSEVESTPSGSQAGSEFHKGVGKVDDRLLILLDLHRLVGKGNILP